MYLRLVSFISYPICLGVTGSSNGWGKVKPRHTRMRLWHESRVESKPKEMEKREKINFNHNIPIQKAKFDLRTRSCFSCFLSVARWWNLLLSFPLFCSFLFSPYATCKVGEVFRLLSLFQLFRLVLSTTTFSTLFQESANLIILTNTATTNSNYFQLIKLNFFPISLTFFPSISYYFVVAAMEVWTSKKWEREKKRGGKWQNRCRKVECYIFFTQLSVGKNSDNENINECFYQIITVRLVDYEKWMMGLSCTVSMGVINSLNVDEDLFCVWSIILKCARNNYDI